MSAVASSSATHPGVDALWGRIVWNELEHTREEHKFVYELSWIDELGLWRTFLRSHHKVCG